MEVKEAIYKRISVRGFLDKPIEKDKLLRVLELSTRAASWKNAQAYKMIVVQGTKRKRLEQRFIEAIEAGVPETPDFPYQEQYPSYIKKRMVELGYSYYSHLGVDRKDKEKRQALMLKNFRFFHAPCAIFFLMEKDMGYWPSLDLGILLGTIMIAARDEGLETVAQASLSSYPGIIKEELSITDNWKIAVGMSIGYPDPNDPANSFFSKREPLSELLEYIDD
jgi:nitroreductase